MNIITRFIAVGALVAGAATIVAPPALSATGAALANRGPGNAQSFSHIQTAQYRGRRSGGRRSGFGSGRNRGGYGRGGAIGLGALIIGGIILSESQRSAHRSDHSDDWQRCATTFRSFESDTGMYTGFDGTRRPCPYLR